MQLSLVVFALIGMSAAASACWSCYSSPCYWCGGGGGGFSTYRPTYYNGGSSSAAASAASSGYGGSSSAAAASSSSGGGGFGGSSSAAASASSSGWGSSSAAAAASSSSSRFGNYYWDVDSSAAQQVKDEQTACAVLVEQFAEHAIAPQELVQYVNATFFGPNVKRDYKNDATPSTFHCCHAKYGATLFKAGRDKAPVVVVAGIKPVKIDYTVPVLPKGETCDSLITKLFVDVKKLAGAADVKTTKQ